MMRCDQCHSLMLDYLYGLLDEPDAEGIESHLRECSSCSAARDEAARVQGLLSRAARTAFPNVRFEPPPSTLSPLSQSSADAPFQSSVATAQSPAPASAPLATLPRRSLPIGACIAWAIAASILLAIPGVAIPVLNVVKHAEFARKGEVDSQAAAAVAISQAEQASREIQNRRDSLTKNLADAHQAQELLLASWVDAEKSLQKTQAARKLTVDLFKPATPQPGAPNDFLLVLHDRGLNPSTKLFAEIRDQTDAVIYSQKLESDRHDNQHILKLPAQAWTRLSPQSELFLVVAAVDEKTNTRTLLQDKIRLSGPIYTTMLVTDRPAYHPGEMLFFRSLTLDRVTFQPPSRELNLQFELRGPGQQDRAHLIESGSTDLARVQDGKIDPVLGPDGKPVRGVGCGAFLLPRDLPDGDYTLALTEPRHPPGVQKAIQFQATRTVRVRSGAAEQYAKQLGFAAASYAPGQIVEAWAEIKFQNQPVAQAEVKAVAISENLQLNTISAPTTGADGRTRFRFQLPANQDLTDVRVKVTFKTRNGEETVAERVPVSGRKLKIEFFPEGGTLVAGVASRVYVRATTADGRAVDIRGTVTDGKNVLAEVETLKDPDQRGANRGLGWFTYTPSLGVPAWLKLQSPAGAFGNVLDLPVSITPAVVAGVPVVVASRTGFQLPAAEAQGVVMSVLNPVSAPGEPIQVQLQSVGVPRNLVIGAYTRGRLSDTQRMRLESRQSGMLKLMANPDPRGGVVRITVFEEPAEVLAGKGTGDLKPLAERLVFRKPGESLHLALAANGKAIESPGTSIPMDGPIELAIAATNEKDQPVPAILWAAAVNTAVAPGKRDRLLPTHFLLAGEVSTPDTLEDADFLLTNHPRAAEALDLVLGTQGWRKFVEQTPSPFPLQRGMANMDAAKQFQRLANSVDRLRLFNANGQYTIATESQNLRDRRKLYEDYWPRYQQASKTLAQAQAAIEAARTDPATETRLNELAENARQAQKAAQSATERTLAARDSIERLHLTSWYGIASFGSIAVLLGLLAAVRPPQRLPYGIGTIGSVGLLAFLLITLNMSQPIQAGSSAQSNAEAPITQSPSAPQPPEASPLASEFAAKKTGNSGEVQLGRAGEFPKEPRQMPKAGLASASPMRLAQHPPEGAPTPASISPMQNDPPGSVMTGRPPFGGLSGGGLGGGGAGGRQGGPGGGFGQPVTPGVAGKSVAEGVAADSYAEKDAKSSWQPRDARRLIHDWELNAPNEQNKRELTLQSGLADAGPSPEIQMKRTSQRVRSDANDRAYSLNLQLEELRRKESDVQEKEKSSAAKGTQKKLEPNSAVEAAAYNHVKEALLPIQPLIVREYAPARAGSVSEAEQNDTILWQPVIVLPSDGKKTLTLQPGAARGGYQIIVAGHTLDGRIGAVRGVITPAQPAAPAVAPASVPPMLP